MTEETIIRVVLYNTHNNFTIDNIIQSTSMFDSEECYISIEKFQAQIHNINNSSIMLMINGVENCFDNNIGLNTHIQPSNIIDIFMGDYTGLLAGVNTITNFNVINNTANWIKINRNSLQNLKFRLLLDGRDIDFNNNIILKIKYIKNKN
jgi:hypothetical protein